MKNNLNRRDFLSQTGAGVGGLTFVGLSGGRRALAEDVKTLVVAWDTDIDSLDPAVYRSIAAFVITANIYDSPLMWKVQPVSGANGVFRAQPGEFDPSVVESWSMEDSDKTIVLKIRKGLTFPSGRSVNATAIKYLFERNLQSPGYMSHNYPTLIHVTKPEQFEVRDDQTLAINMTAPSPMLLDVLSIVNNCVIDPDEIKPHATSSDPWAADWMKRNAAGLGPYRLIKNEPGVEIVLEATPNHWRGRPFFERVVFKFVPNESDRVLLLKRRAVDLVAGRPGLSPKNVKLFEGDKNFRIVSVPDTTCHFLAMNCKKAPFDNVKVRQAINYAIPIEAIIPNVLFGYGAQMKSPVPSLTPGYDATLSPYKYDIGKAQSLMKEAGVNSPIPVDLAVRVGWQTHEQASIWIQRELEKIGFKVNIVKETDATFRQLAGKGDHQLSIESWQSWVNDPYYHLNFNFHSKSKSSNVAFYSNPEIDRLLDENMHEVDKEKRLAAARQMQKILLDDAAWGLLWYENWTRVTRADLMGIEKRWDTFERYFDMRLS